MQLSQDKSFVSDGKKLVLIVDDEPVNRELLGAVLSEEYDVIFACDGYEALDRIHEFGGVISIIMLDLLMPRMHGFQLLDILKEENILTRIPVIVLTSERDSEVESLKRGASDFIQKPYNIPEVILARVRKTIELFEDRSIIKSTERDPLTGLYNTEYFYRYSDQFDRFHPDKIMDAIVIDVNHFHHINERYGRAFGDIVLRSIGGRLKDTIGKTGGIVCRRGGDTFLIYCPHIHDHTIFLETAAQGISEALSGLGGDVGNVRLRMGVYPECDRTIDIERRFDRAKMASDTIRSSYRINTSYYDHSLHEKEMYELDLSESVTDALREKQFRVYYQPKFDIRGEIPLLSSAEALVRWEHPKYGIIYPGDFIHILEENGMIPALDRYVWSETACQIRKWRELYDLTIPVSVNVSRVDLFDQNLSDELTEIVSANGIDPNDLLLEITESAYSDDSDRIISSVKKLKADGFKIEMDDFGSGYSSLSMLSAMPIDILKMDIRFLQNAGTDYRIVKLILDFASALSITAVSEGVETKAQFEILRSLKCDIVQGYYFSKPVPAEEFCVFIEERKNLC